MTGDPQLTIHPWQEALSHARGLPNLEQLKAATKGLFAQLFLLLVFCKTLA
jgi:hypothetical protein